MIALLQPPWIISILKCPNKHEILMGKMLLFVKLSREERERVWRRVDVKRVKILRGTPGSPFAGYASSVYLHNFFILIFIFIFVCTVIINTIFYIFYFLFFFFIWFRIWWFGSPPQLSRVKAFDGGRATDGGGWSNEFNDAVRRLIGD